MPLFSIEHRTLLEMPPPARPARGARRPPIVGAYFASSSPEVLVPYADPIVRRVVPGANRPQRQIIGAIGYFESRYGVQGAFAPGGDPSYNWGAITGAGNAGSTTTKDHDKNGKLVTVDFRKYASADDGLRDFMKVWARPFETMMTLAGDGDAQGVATQMFRNGYYVGFGSSDAERIAGYAKAIYGAAKAYATVLGEPLEVRAPSGASTKPYVPAGEGSGSGVFELDPVVITASPPSKGGGGLLVAGLGAAAGLFLLSRAMS